MLAVRRIIFANHNDPDTPFTNDQVLDAMKQDDLVDESVTIDDMEPVFKEICASGLVRDIAQNFTTIWLKLFDAMTEANCASCGPIYLGSQEALRCPACGSSV